MKDNKFTPSDKGANQNKLPVNINTPSRGTYKHLRRNKESDRPITLTDEQTRLLISCFSDRARQARRLIKALSKTPDSPTGHLNKKGGVNLSCLADQQINEKIVMHGFCVDCREPPTPIINGYGEKSGQELWGIYKK